MVARDKCGIYLAHHFSAVYRRNGLFVEAQTPSDRPQVIRFRILEKYAHFPIAFRTLCGIAKFAEGQGKVGAVGGHAVKQILDQPQVAFALGKETKFAAKAGELKFLECLRELGERL